MSTEIKLIVTVQVDTDDERLTTDEMESTAKAALDEALRAQESRGFAHPYSDIASVGYVDTVIGGDDRPEMAQLFVVVHGEAFVAEAFDNEADADEFAEKAGDEYHSGPWTVNTTTPKYQFAAEVPEFEGDGGTHDYDKLSPINIEVAEALRVVLGPVDAKGMPEPTAPSLFMERRKDGWFIAVAHESGGDATMLVRIPDNKELPIETESNFGPRGGPAAEYDNG